MFLKKLIVESTDGVVREIQFHAGLNFVVDETTDVKTESGNSVGKTTVLRIVDFCFGSSGEDIYKDDEFGNVNRDVLAFLENKFVVFNLIISIKDRDIVLRRSFAEDRILEIDNETYKSLSQYKEQLAEKLLHIQSRKPSVRQLMPKFIRKDHQSMSNTLYFLDPHSKPGDYEIVHLFLFGFADHHLLVDKLVITQRLKKVKNRRTALLQGKTPNAYRQILKVIERDVLSLEDSIKQFKVSETYEREVERLSTVKREIAQRTTAISSLEMRLDLSKSTIADLQKSRSDIDPVAVKDLYTEAKSLIPSIQKTFEEVLTFHNRMIGKKITFITKQVSELEGHLAEQKAALNIMLGEERKVLMELADTGSLADLQKIQRELNAVYEKKGQEEKVLSLVEETDVIILECEKQLEKLREQVNEYIQELDKRVGAFNLIFSDYSKKLYEEEFYLSFDAEGSTVKFVVDNVAGNEGGGKKKGQIAAFDLAYISFLSQQNSNMFRFVMHDSIEDVHQNQLSTLFEIADSLDGQYVVAILKNSLQFMGEEFINAHKIIGLSQKEKFFKV